MKNKKEEERVDRFLVWLSKKHPDRALPCRNLARILLQEAPPVKKKKRKRA